MTVEQLPHGGSLQARMLSTQAVQLYWRYSLDGRTFREPIGVHDPSAPPKKMEPTPRGFSLAAVRERCRELAMRHEQHRDDGGLRGAARSSASANAWRKPGKISGSRKRRLQRHPQSGPGTRWPRCSTNT